MAIQDRVKKLVRPEIRAMKAYEVADADDLIKLDAMENPYPWPEEIKRAWLERLRTVDVNRYPDPAASELKARLREAMEVPAGQDLLLGNGSDELIQIILMALAKPGAKVLAPVPTFVMYAITARVAGMEFVGVPLHGADFGLDMAAMCKAITEHRPAVIFLAYPNNPTGNLFTEEDVETIINAADGLVVLDEAYYAFADSSFLGRLGEFDNLVVMRTVSKLGLAGLRLGLLAGDKAWLAEFDKVRLPYNINSLIQVSAEFVLAKNDFLDRQTAGLRVERDKLFAALTAMEEIEVWPSQANFVLFRSGKREASEVFDGLRQAGILVKNLDKTDPALSGCLRVTVGTPEENKVFLQTLSNVI